jgi:multicomponent Na+:H+ antiporter subunit G
VTLELARQWAGGGLAVAGGILVLIGALGLIRMPDVFTRLHAASVVDGLGAGAILLGLMLLAGLTLVTVKLVFLLLFFGLLNPVATHAVARAALHAGTRPLLADDADGEAPVAEAPTSKR